MSRLIAFGLWLALSQSAAAQSAAANPFTSDIRRDYRSVRDYFVRAADKMPDDKYGFRPSPDVRTFAQQVAHVADDQYNLCSAAKGEQRKASYTDIESRLSTKAELVVALRDAFAFCDAVYDAMTDAAGLEPSSGMKGRSKFSYLNWNLWHTWEHYGNIVVYLRMNGLVPPSSEKQPAPAAKPPANEEDRGVTSSLGPGGCDASRSKGGSRRAAEVGLTPMRSPSPTAPHASRRSPHRRTESRRGCTWP